MNENDAAQNRFGRGGVGSIADPLPDRLARRLTVAPQLPKDFKAIRTGNGVRLSVKDRDKNLDRSGTVQYVFAWTASVDTSTQAGRDSGATRSEQCGQVTAVGTKDYPLSFFVSDPKFQSGTFFCWGVDQLGNRTDTYLWSQLISNEILDNSVPSDATHVQISGSGEYIGSDVVEAISVSLRAPAPLGSFDGVQLYLKDYINLGTMQEGEFHRYSSAPGGSLQFKVNYQVAKRIGIGTATLTNGSVNVTGVSTKFLSQCQPGDKIETANYRATIATVTDDTHLTLTGGGWLFNTVATTDFCFYALVTIYVVSISKAGTRRSDVTNSPSAAIVFDGSLTAPNAPAAITATTLGNAIRIEFQAVLGTQIKSYRLYRGVGSGAVFPTCALLDEIPNPKNANQFQSNIHFEDSSFTPYQKEQGQTFTYWVTSVNERGDESAPTGPANASCRLDSPNDTEIGGTIGLKNQLYNAMFAGTAGNVLDTDANQDANLFTFVDGGYTPGTAGRPYGGNGGQIDGTGRYKGYTRWAGTKTGGAAAVPTFVNGNEIKMPAPGGGQACYAFQEIGAWDDGRAQFMKAKKDGFIVFQIKVRHGGVQPNGTFYLVVEQYNNNLQVGWVPRQYKDTNSVIQYATGAASEFPIAGSKITSTWQTFWAIYHYNSALGTTKQVRLTLKHADSSAGDVYVCDPMVNEGTERGAWTADMGDPYISQPLPTNPPPAPPIDGLRPWDVLVP